MKTTVQHMKALADPTRLRLVALLLQGGLCVCQLEAALAMSQVNVSRHLAILRQAGILADRREGRWMYYGLAEPMAPGLQGVIECLMRDLIDDPTIQTDRVRAEAVRCVQPGTVPASTIHTLGREVPV